MSKSILGGGLSSGCTSKSLFNINSIISSAPTLNGPVTLNSYLFPETQTASSSFQSFINTQNILIPGAQNSTSSSFIASDSVGPTGATGPSVTISPSELILGNSGILLTPQTKTFVIDHPVDNNKYLVHGCLEGPEAGVYYRGKGIINNNSRNVTIFLPNYVDKIASDFTVHITPIYNGSTIVYSATEVVNNQFTVYGFPGSFSWIVYGKRESINIEPDKTNITLMGDGPYKWIQ